MSSGNGSAWNSDRIDSFFYSFAFVWFAFFKIVILLEKVIFSFSWVKKNWTSGTKG